MVRVMKISKLYTGFFFLLIPVLVSGLAYAEGPVFNKLTTNNGLSHNTVYSITQDNKGFMWFGTREGLNRYDGNTIVTFYANPYDSTKLASNVITALELGPDGVLYIGTSSGLQMYDEYRGVFRRVRFNKSEIGNVNRILSTSDGTLLVGGKKGLFVLKKGQSSLSQLKSGVNAIEIVEFKKGAFWVCTLQKIFMINEHGEVLREYATLLNTLNQSVSMDQNIFCLFKDSLQDLWLGSKKNGLFRYDIDSDSFKPVIVHHRSNPLEVNAVRAISEDADKRLWIGTESGLFIYDRIKQSFQHFNQSFDRSPSTLSDKAIYDIYRGKEGIMWIGTYFGGVNIVKPREKGFKKLEPDGGYKGLSGKAISDIIQDKRDNLWIATEDGGVNIWNRKTGSISYLKNEFGKQGLSVNNVHSIYEDDNEIFWIGTFLGGVNKYDLKNKTVKIYKKREEETASFPSNMVYAIHKDRNGELWVGTTVGLNKFNNKKGTYESFKPEVFTGKFIYEIYEEHSGGLWICVMESDSLFHYNPMTNQLKKFRYYDSAFSAANGFISVLEDSKGQMWFGTINRGLLKLDPASGKFTTYKEEQGLPNNYVYGILEDSHGNLWMSTNKGLSKFNIQQQRFSNYDISHGLPDNQFNFKSAFKDKDGWMYFGTINGLCYFHPDSLMENNSGPLIYLSDLKLFNKSVAVEAGGILEKTIDNTNEITLRYTDNVITLEFGAIGYYSSGNNKYAYYMEGFEQGWNYVQRQNNATYTNLSPGTYTFKVKSANNDGFWSDNIRELKVVVLPPFWLSKWAMILYGVITVGLFVLYRTFLNYRNKEKMAVQLERIESEKITEINRHKLNFFTYISHEFKTPLTLIIASIDKFLQDKSLNEDQSAGYWSIKRSAKRLHFLIEQLMEFRRVETDHAQVNYAKGDIVLFLQDTFMAFSPLFTKKQIDFYFNSDTTTFNTFFDADKLEKIITNLLSNAAKYTEERGLIEMEVSIKANPEDETDNIKMIINDSGMGMKPEELENVFTVFYQTENGKKSGHGTGIGLALVKGLVDFLNGSIKIESSPEAGTQVTLVLPLPKQVTKERVVVIDGNRSIDIEHVLPFAIGNNDQKNPEDNAHKEYQLMIVEDSEELIDFLSEHFDKSYKIVKAGNGAVALDKIKKSAPDIIISDVMMPDMDGIELCQAIRSDINISHIPVILLTAKTTVENRLDGLDAGADAYIAKPFSLKELQLVVKNLISTRDSLRNHFLQFGSVKGMDVSFTNRDQDFILKLTRIVKEHLDNPEFSITLFAQEACVSRSLLHLKLKKLVNLSASEFIRHIRLQKAAELLKSTDQSIAEVAYMVGYSDSKYFSRSFKEKYQVNPTEYKQSVSKEA
jgi:ligand-binding sensor domain-containing protein/signal transduction histidine kinase/DNA-binding response OmpR family regulator